MEGMCIKMDWMEERKTAWGKGRKHVQSRGSTAEGGTSRVKRLREEENKRAVKHKN